MRYVDEESRMNLMYSVVEMMGIMGLPIVLKGALLLRHIMLTNGVVDTTRMTRDIDMNWNVEQLNYDSIIKNIEKAISKTGLVGFEVVQRREAMIGVTAGLDVKCNGKVLFSMDINITNDPFYSMYVTPSGVVFAGASINKIYADKVSAISSKKVFRRSKDIYDLFLLSRLEGYGLMEINTICKYQGNNIGDFFEFLNNVSDINHAYNKLRGIINKPEFETLYGRVRDFCVPFIVGSYKNCNGYWNPKDSMWYEV